MSFKTVTLAQERANDLADRWKAMRIDTFDCCPGGSLKLEVSTNHGESFCHCVVTLHLCYAGNPRYVLATARFQNHDAPKVTFKESSSLQEIEAVLGAVRTTLEVWPDED